MTDFYINADTGSDGGGSGTSGDPWATIPFAHAAMGNDDRLLLQPSAAAYQITAQLTLGATAQRFKMSAVDASAVVCADDPAGFDRGSMRPGDYGDMAVVEVNFAGSGFSQTHADTMAFHGIIFDGLSTAAEAYFSSAGGADALFVVCVVRDFTVRGLRFRQSTCREVLFQGNVEGCETIEGPNIFESCVFGQSGGLASDKFNINFFQTFRNCTFYSNGGGAFAYCIDDPDTNGTFQNCLFVDGTCGHGLPGSIQATGNCYTSNPAVFHNQGNYNGATDANDLELDPLFIDAAAGDFRLGNETLITGGTANAVPRLFDGSAMPVTPPIGAMGGVPSSTLLTPGSRTKALVMDLAGLTS